MPILIYDRPRHATYTPPGGTISFPVLVTGERSNFGRTDYRIASVDAPSLPIESVSQYVTGDKLAFDPEEGKP